MPKPRNYTKICLTGGPCSGKTSALSTIKEHFSSKYIVYEVPELGTLSFNGGINILPSSFTPEEHKVFTHAICKLQMDLEEYFERLAELQKRPVLIITDRGVVDNFAYTPSGNKQKILQENNWTMNLVRDARYDMVIDLITAASGALDSYTRANNDSRSESPDEAIDIGHKNSLEYIGHPNLRVIDNTNRSFQEKLFLVITAIGAFVEGIPETFYVKNYLLPSDFVVDLKQNPIEHHNFSEKLTRLQPIDEQNVIVYLSEKFNHPNEDPLHELIVRRSNQENPEVSLETRQFISKEDYEKHLLKKDSAFQSIKRVGISHLHRIESQHFIISLGKTRFTNGKERYILRLIRDSLFTVQTVLPNYASGAQILQDDLFNFLETPSVT